MKAMARRGRKAGLLAVVLGCNACSFSGPVSIFADNGQILRGGYEASPTAGGPALLSENITPDAPTLNVTSASY